MADINFADAPDDDANASPNNAPEPLWELIELLFFAYRDFTHDPDARLETYGFGRAHHRVLHFVNRNPGLSVADLLDILKITKQSLARVLKQLVDEGYIEQRAGPSDRRQRLLYATDGGKALARELAASQSTRIAEALQSAGPQAQKAFRDTLFHMVEPDEREYVLRLTEAGTRKD